MRTADKPKPRRKIKRNHVNLMEAVVPAIAAEEQQRKVYVLDTNVMLHDPSSMFRFQEHIVVIPLYGLDEIDRKKSDPIIGFNAREVSRKLEQIISSGAYSPVTGTRIRNGFDGLLFILAGHEDANFPPELELEYFDNYLLASVMRLKREVGDRPVILVTKDRNLRIKCHALGMKAEDYLHDRVTEESLTGISDPLREIVLKPDEVSTLFAGRRPSDWTLDGISRFRLRYNEGVILRDESANLVGLGIREGDVLRYLAYDRVRTLGVGPKVLDKQNHSHNFEQAICMVQAMNDDVKIQVIVGKAGTGKTHIAMAAALEHVFLRRKYDSVKLIKPIVTKSRLGEDIGFLPGSLKRKLLPRMRPFIEKLQKLTGSEILNMEQGYQRMMEEGIIEMMNLADIRGSDLSGSVILFDEAQNANPFQLRTLGTRLGEDSKMMVMGDPSQIDNIYLDKYSNALVNLYQHARRSPEPFIATISLLQMVRSYTSRWFEEKIISKS